MQKTTSLPLQACMPSPSWAAEDKHGMHGQGRCGESGGDVRGWRFAHREELVARV